MVSKIIEGTILLIIIFIVISNGNQFSQVVKSVGGVYIGSVKTLQGR